MCVCVCLGRAHGADDFLPVMMYVLARSNLSALQMDVEYMMELMDPSLTLGEGTDMHTAAETRSTKPVNSLFCWHIWMDEVSVLV